MKMIGKFCPFGPGGRDCACCGDAPGKARRLRKRNVKRSERNKMRRDIRKDN